MRRTGFKGLVATGLVAAGVAASTTAVSASDMFLKIANITGESQDAKHKGEIDVLAWSWGQSTGTGKTRRGTIPSACIQDLSLTKYVDSGWVRSNSHTPFSTCRPGALPMTTQSWGARTCKVYGALRSGWSKQAKIVGAASMKDMP